MVTKESILNFIASEPARLLRLIPDSSFARLSEIRLRADKPLLAKIGGEEFAVSNEGDLSGNATISARRKDMSRRQSSG